MKPGICSFDLYKLDTHKILNSHHIKLHQKVIKEDDLVDQREKDLRNKHIERINSWKCTPAAGVIYLDILSNLERVADHANNIADLVAESKV